MENKLSYSKLTAIIVGSTVGAGIYTTTGDMAASGAHTGSIIIGWIICGIGMLGIMMSFYGLNKVRPDLTDGIYSYAREQFGEYVGFSSAWGYWFSSLMANVSYFVLLFSAIGYFFPVFGGGNNLVSIICASILLWLVNWLVLRGITQAAAVNLVTTICKLIPIFVFIIAVIFTLNFKPSIFIQNFWGNGDISLIDQIRSTNSGTVWSFLGIEGIVVISARAKKKSDIGKAAMTGFVGILIIYVLVAMLSLGTMPIEDMAKLQSPQLAGILEVVIGPFGATLVNIGLIISLLGSLLSWTIISVECPSEAANQGAFMKIFARKNKHGSPVFSLFLTNGIIQFFLITILINESTYQAVYTMGITMIMFPYAFSAIYYAKLCFTKQGFENSSIKERTASSIFAILGVIYSFWMLYCSSYALLLPAAVIYAAGIIVYVLGRKEKNAKIFDKKYEMYIAVAVVIIAVIAIVMMIQGKITLL